MGLSIREKVSYALGDGAANIAWRGVSTFLMIYYLDVFGLSPVVVGTLMLVARFSDGISDVLMGAVCDRTKSKYGKFRPWVLWTAVPLAIILSLLFTCPNWDTSWKIAYAYATYIMFTLIYTANNIPYGALMGVMTPDDKERTSLGSFRMVGAFAGGMLVQGLLLFLVAYFGNTNPEIKVSQIEEQKQQVVITFPNNVEKVNIQTEHGIATLSATGENAIAGAEEPTQSKSFSAKANTPYTFTVEGESDLQKDDFRIVDQTVGYSHAIYLLSIFLAFFLILTFLGTKERVEAPKTQESNIKEELKDLCTNKPWIILLVVGLLFNIYNCTKQGITVIYFTHYIHNQLMASYYMVGLMIASIFGAMLTTPLSRRFGKKVLFIGALIFSGAVNSLLWLCGQTDTTMIFAVGMLSELSAAIFPTLFFTMLGDVADYSEYVNHRRSTGLIYSAGSFATKFGGGIAGALTGWILGMYNYQTSADGAAPGIVMLMSWVPALLCMIAAVLMAIYPINQKRQEEITLELEKRRAEEA